MVFIENIARYLNIDRPKPFEIIIPKKTNQTEEARTTSMCYGLDLDEDGGKTLAAEVMFSTHSKLYGFPDRHPKDEAAQRDVRFMTKPLARELRPAVEAIDFITTAMENEDDDSTIEDEWKYIALIIDRLLLYIYCFFVIFGSIYFFWSIDYAGIWALQTCAAKNEWEYCNNNLNYSNFGVGPFGMNA